MKHRTKLLLALLPALILLAGCAQPAPVTFGDARQLPDYVQSAAPRVQAAYQFAMTHHQELASVPCYCGCGKMGHTSNLSCFIKQDGQNGSAPVFEQHAAGCGICVDIAQDVMRMSADHKSLPAIRSYIDATYSSYGPATDTPLPAAN